MRACHGRPSEPPFTISLARGGGRRTLTKESPPMTEEHLSAILDFLSAKPDKEGWSTLADGRAITLYAAHDGVQLTVARVEAVASKGGLLRARTNRGELYLLALQDVFAAAAEGTATQTRKAGF